MRNFDEILDIAASRKGGADALNALLATPLTKEEIAQTPDDRWLAAMAKCVFQAGFSWKVIEAKWPGFETAFEGFEVQRVAFYHDEDMDRLLSDASIVRNGAKIGSVVENARFVDTLARQHGGAGKFFAEWPDEDFSGLLTFLSKEGARLGGTTGQRVMRSMGRNSFVMSPDVVARLVAEGVIDKAPSSKGAMRSVQDAFNTWCAQSGRGLTQVSQVLAFSI